MLNAVLGDEKRARSARVSATLPRAGAATDTSRVRRTGNTGCTPPGSDTLDGGPGDDVIDARDREEDMIDCGPGNDTVYVDITEDGVFDCENVVRPPGGF